MQVMTALEAAQALVAALGVRFGRIEVDVAHGDIRVSRKLTTLTSGELASMAVPDPSRTHFGDPEY